MRTEFNLIDSITGVHTMVPGESTPREFVSVSIYTGDGPKGLTLKMSRSEALALLHSLRAGLSSEDLTQRFTHPEDYR